MFAARGVLEAEALPDALSKAVPPGRSGGYNHLLATRTGEIGNLESSAGAHHYSSGGQVVFHTNHYLSPEMLPFEKGASPHFNAGLFDHVDAAMMFHPGCSTRIQVTTLACREYFFIFHGQNAHAACEPWEGRNALGFTQK